MVSNGRALIVALEVATAQDVPGFVSNALLMPFINEAIMCLEKVALALNAVIQELIYSIGRRDAR